MKFYESMRWMNEPNWIWADDALRVETKPATDLWQRTYYGFRHDNAHALLCPVPDTFRIAARFRFFPNAQYDQCGLLIRAGEECWFKCSVEFEPEADSRLGSVVTNHGYSDWATQDIPSSVVEMSYEVRVKDLDLIAAHSLDGVTWRQMRIAHLAAHEPLTAGIYGCSPLGQGFGFEVLQFTLE